MDLNEYQKKAQETDRVPARENRTPGDELMVPLLGLAGEAGELLSEYKKQIRDGKAHILFPARVEEELGDILWYVANLATKFKMTLEDVAQSNLKKTQDRWGASQSAAQALDATDPEALRFPRHFVVELREVTVNGELKIRGYVDGKPLGDDLTDNSYDPDGYRFHDVFHLGYVAVLGWSPVVRKLMGRKRKNDRLRDEVEDGGRAQVVDEGIAALVFEYARQHDWLATVEDLDYHLLRTIKGITAHLEVKDKTMKDWQNAILDGFKVWRQVRDANGGRIEVDLDAKSLRFLGAATPHHDGSAAATSPQSQ